MNRLDAAHEQYEDQFRPAEEVSAKDRKEHIKARTLELLRNPREKDIDVLIMEDEYLLNFVAAYYSAKTEEGQKKAIIDLLKGCERIAVQVATEETDG